MVEKGVDNVKKDASEDGRGLGEAHCDDACPYAISIKPNYRGERKIIRDGEDLGLQKKVCSEFGFDKK